MNKQPALKEITAANVVQEVTNCFTALGQHNPEAWTKALPSSFGPNPTDRFITNICNRVLRDIFISYEQRTGAATFDARVLLRDEDSLPVWFKGISEGVVPYIVQQNIMG
jgi:hypothetical protein